MKYILLIFIWIFLLSCTEGYQKKNGQWAWVSYGESFKKRVLWLGAVDKKSFTILTNKNYARDKDKVFHSGRIIKGADPNTFVALGKQGYAKDKHSVYLDLEIIIFANPVSFEILEFPYTKDENKVFCGTLPLDLKKHEAQEFKVLNTDQVMSGMKSTILLSHFIELNPQYHWLDTLGIDKVIVGEWATGEILSRQFRGFKEIK